MFKKKFRNHFHFLPEFYLIIWLMTSPKNFEKIPILKTWQLVFFWAFKTYFGISPLKWCIFRMEKINILTTIYHSLRSNLYLDTLSTLKWPSEPQFCERYLCSWQKNDQKWLKNGHFWNISFQVFFFQNWKAKLSKTFVIDVLAFDPIKV